MPIISVTNDTYFDPLPQDRAPEDMNFSQPYDDKEIRRTNPKRYDKRTDWDEENNEKGHDSDVSNRYESIGVTATLQKIEHTCIEPSLAKIAELKAELAKLDTASFMSVYDAIHERLDVLEWDQSHFVKEASNKIAMQENVIYHYVLQQLLSV